MVKHLAVFKDFGAEDILLGKKTVEIRFSKKKTPPYGAVSSGDLVYIKTSGKDIIGQFRVKKVNFYDNPEQKDGKYKTEIFTGECLRFITSPIKLLKKTRSDWVVFD